jgi:IS4 transposase
VGCLIVLGAGPWAHETNTDKFEIRPRRGYRVKEVLLVTTLLDAVLYPASELASLYQRRWEIETNL